MKLLFEVCPYFKFGYMAANGAIAKALKDEYVLGYLKPKINFATENQRKNIHRFNHTGDNSLRGKTHLHLMRETSTGQ